MTEPAALVGDGCLDSPPRIASPASSRLDPERGEPGVSAGGDRAGADEVTAEVGIGIGGEEAADAFFNLVHGA